MPLLPVDPAPPPPSDRQTVFDALSFVQAPINVTRLAELLADRHTTRGTGFNTTSLRGLLGELLQAQQVGCNAQGQWWASPALSWPRFVALVQQSAERERWWAAWRRLYRFDNTWHLEVFGDEAMVGALRVVVYAGGTPEAYDRLCSLSRSTSPQQPGLLAAALLRPFEPALWQRLNPDLRFPLLRLLLNHPSGDSDLHTVALWTWLLAESQPDPGQLHELSRLRLAERLVLAGQSDEARRVLLGLDLAEAQAIRAAADIADGHYVSGAVAFELAWKEQAATVGRRKHLFTDATSWFYLLALIAQPDPALWTKARKFAAGEAGKRDADAYTFWGVWQEAIDQRLGDAPRNPRAFVMAPLQGYRLHGLMQLSHWLLAAWLGHKPPQPAVLGTLAAKLSSDYAASGQPWLAMMVRRSAASLRGVGPETADAAQPFPIGAPVDRWREALTAIVALGAVGGAAAAGAAAGGVADA